MMQQHNKLNKIAKKGDSALTKDCVSLFSGNQFGHIGIYAYSTPKFIGDTVNGSQLWANFVKNSQSYYIPTQENLLIQEAAPCIIKLLPNIATLIDLGVGSLSATQSKTLPFIRSSQKLKYYIPVDISLDFMTQAKFAVRQEKPSVHIHPCIADFMCENIIYPVELPVLALSFGGSVTNIAGNAKEGVPIAKIIHTLKHFSKLIGHGGHFVVTQDTNQNGEEIISSYIHPDHSKMEENLMHRIARDCPVNGNFNPNAWQYEPVWIAENSQLCHTVVAQAAQEFELAGKSFSFAKGHRLHLDNSFKYPIDLFQDMAQQAGFDVVKTYTKKGNHIALHVLRAR